MYNCFSTDPQLKEQRLWPKTILPPIRLPRTDIAELCLGETPGMPAGMTPEQLAEAKQYGRYSLACTLADKVLDLLFLTFAAVVLARPLDAWLQGWSLLERFASLRLVVFFLLVTLLHMGVSLLAFLLFRFHPGTSLPPQHPLGGRLGAAIFEAELVGLALGTVLILGMYWLIWTTHGWWWLAAAGAFFCVTIIMGRDLPRAHHAAVL